MHHFWSKQMTLAEIRILLKGRQKERPLFVGAAQNKGVIDD